MKRTVLALVATTCLAGCIDIDRSPTAKQMRKEGRPYPIKEADGFVLYEWQISAEDNAHFVVHKGSNALGTLLLPDATPPENDLTPKQHPDHMKPQREAALAKLTDEDKRVLGLVP